jgi:hypothetical protein
LTATPAPARTLRLTNRYHFTLVLLLVLQNIGVGGLGLVSVMPVKTVLLDGLPDCSFIDWFAWH